MRMQLKICCPFEFYLCILFVSWLRKLRQQTINLLWLLFHLCFLLSKHVQHFFDVVGSDRLAEVPSCFGEVFGHWDVRLHGLAAIIQQCILPVLLLRLIHFILLLFYIVFPLLTIYAHSEAFEFALHSYKFKKLNQFYNKNLK